MERLTKTKEREKEFENFCSVTDCGLVCEKCFVEKIYNRLAELKDKLESGLLVELPCIREVKGSQGTEYQIYFIRTIEPNSGSIDYYRTKDKAQAEARLKELQEKL